MGANFSIRRAVVILLSVGLALTACSKTKPSPEDVPVAPPVAAGAVSDAMRLSAGQHVMRYFENVWYDFSDAFQFGLGVTLTNTESGWPKPYPGLYFQMTDFLKLGAMHYNGWSAEIDGRGYFAGRETRTRFSAGTWDALRLDQKYDTGYANYFKKGRTHWAARMWSDDMVWGSWTPAKELRYDSWSERLYTQWICFPRGWQHWSNISMEVGMIFVQVRMGLDVVELHEWVLGLFGIDLAGDDLTPEEYLEKRNMGDEGEMPSPRPAS